MDFAKEILITGFPGFIAGRLVERLASPQSRFHLLVEPRFKELGESEVRSISTRTGLPIENFVLYKGDITNSDLGLGKEEVEHLASTVTDVFHLAAIYDLAVDSEPARRVNVQGTANVNDLVAKLSKLTRYNYISTCYVAGKRTGRILESELEHSAGFRNHYEETKYLAELSVEKLKSSLPVTIIRPSVVVGDSRTGETVKYDGIYYLIKYLLIAPSMLRFINVGNHDVTLNLIPVDFVVDGIKVISESTDSIGKTLALADPNPMTTAALFDAIAKALAGGESIATPPSTLVELFLKSPISPPLTGLPHSGVPYFFIKQEYDVSDAMSILGSSGIECPPFSSYVENLIKYVKEHPTL